MPSQDETKKILDEIKQHRDEIKKKRFLFLYALYQISQSYSESDQRLDSIMKHSKLNEYDAVRVARYLFDEGLIANRADLQRVYGWLGKIELQGSRLRKWDPNKMIRITHKGIIEVEAALDTPEKATEHFPANIINYTIKVERMIGSEIHAGPSTTHLSISDTSEIKPEQVRILFVSANPRSTQPLELIKECNSLRDRILFGEYGDRFHFDQRHEVSVSEMDKYLLDYKPQVLHFSGHGSSDGIIIFEDSYHEAEVASIKAISDLFRIVNGDKTMTDDKRIKLVVLSTCYSERQAEAISEYVDCVVGMSTFVTDEAARFFTESFYQAIGYGKSIKTAFELGCHKVAILNIPEALTPRLKYQPKVDPSSIYLSGKIR